MAEAPDPRRTFLMEVEDLLQTLEESLLDLENQPENRELVDQAFRALHTIKGSGAMFGFEQLAAFTHHVETAFDQVRAGKVDATHELINLTLASMDYMRILIDSPEDCDRIREKTLLESLKSIVGDYSGTPTAAASQSLAVAQEERTCRIRVRFDPSVLGSGTNPLLLLQEIRDLGSVTVVAITDDIPPLEELKPTDCLLWWDILLTTDQPESAIRDVFIFVEDETDLSISHLQGVNDDGAGRLGEILLEKGDITQEDLEHCLRMQQKIGSLLVSRGVISRDRIESALAEQQVREKAKAHIGAESNVKVPASRLDDLMDLVGEMVIAQARLAQQASLSPDLALKAVAEEMSRLAGELRDTTMTMRMLPIGTLFGKFRRVVRDLSDELGKTVELSMSGEETELDKTVIDSLNDPLVHLIRNSIDHGIEAEPQRLASGKSASGKLHLSAQHSGAQVLISVRDDGKGMDRKAIRARAEERGLIEPGEEVSDSELFSMIFQAGFSTASSVSAVSGRGVGMDVVKRTIDNLRGSIDIASESGGGSTVTLKLPLTLAIIDGLRVEVGSAHYVIPLPVVEECVELTRKQDEASDGRSFLNIRGDIVPYLRLWQIFGEKGPTEDIQKVVIVAFGGKRVGLVVDRVVGQHQTVIKSLSSLHADVEEFSGATIMGDGSVALILDVHHLIASAQDQENQLKAS